MNPRRPLAIAWVVERRVRRIRNPDQPEKMNPARKLLAGFFSSDLVQNRETPPLCRDLDEARRGLGGLDRHARSFPVRMNEKGHCRHERLEMFSVPTTLDFSQPRATLRVRWVRCRRRRSGTPSILDRGDHCFVDVLIVREDDEHPSPWTENVAETFPIAEKFLPRGETLEGPQPFPDTKTCIRREAQIPDQPIQIISGLRRDKNFRHQS